MSNTCPEIIITRNERGETVERLCGRQLIEGGDRCIFHDPDAWTTHAELMREEIIRKIEKGDLNFSKYHFPEINFSKIVKEFKGPTDFIGAFFHGNVDFREIKFLGVTRFTEATFLGDVDFYGATFSIAGFDRATFSGDVDFYGATFSVAMFRRVTFSGVAGFFKTTFSKDAVFDLASFAGGARFYEATFSGDAWFGEAMFIGEAVFYFATFSGESNFYFATFSKQAVFSLVRFSGNAWFEDATFSGETLFEGAIFEDDSNFNGVIFQGNVQFNNLQVFKTLEFHQIIIERRFTLQVEKWMPQSTNGQDTPIYSVQIRDPIMKENGKLVIIGSLGTITSKLISGVSIINTELSKVEFIDEIWIKQNGRKIIIDEILLKKHTEGEKNLPYIPTRDQVAQTYRRLRDNYENARRYSEAGDFYIGEMEILRKYGPSPLNRILFFAYNTLARYGESVTLPFLWILLSITLIAEYRCILLRNPPQELFFAEYLKELSLTVKAFFPFNRIWKIRDIITRLVGSLLIGLTFIGIRRRLERR